MAPSSTCKSTAASTTTHRTDTPTALDTDLHAHAHVKMQWIEARDEQLLLFGLERKIAESEHEVIAGQVDGSPTANEVKERLAELEKEAIALRRKLGDAENDED